MLEPGWGPTVAAACPLATGLNGLIMKQRWLLSWRRGRLRQGNTSLMVLSKGKFFICLCVKEVFGFTPVWMSITCYGDVHQM